MGRKLMALATMMLLPGGLILLAAVALVVVLTRTSRGQRLLASGVRHIPPRIRARVERALALVRAEKLFLPEPRSVN